MYRLLKYKRATTITSPHPSLIPTRYPKFGTMAQPGDTIHIARYLVSGAESSSLYLEVRRGGAGEGIGVGGWVDACCMAY